MIYTAKEFFKISTPEEYRRIVERVADMKRAHGQLEATTFVVEEPVYAYVNHARWVIDCECGTGNLVVPGWRTAGCPACGALFTNVVFPPDIEEIEEVLEDRIREHHKNWFPGETVQKLKMENLEHPKQVKGKVK
jgi:hypothetical protein